VVGAGRMGRLAVRAARAGGASVSIANRSPDRAYSLAATTGARVEPFEPGARVGAYAGVVVALGGPWPIGADTVEALRASTTLVVDLSVPAALSDTARRALGPRLISADDLALGAEPEPKEDGSIAKYEALVDRTTAEFLDWLNRRPGRAAAAALIERADRERETELASLWRRLPDLEPEARQAIEGMTRHLARRLLRRPLERLGRDPEGRDERAVRDIFAL
jgi:glutamyl-tRNA reductase